jgi:OTU domain-containing protein 3
MGRSEEFPLLKAQGLKVCEIRGDGKCTRPPSTLHFPPIQTFRAIVTDLLSFALGNCLFNALSDQIFGDQSKHREIRMNVIQHMRENPDNFKPFITVGQGQRRNPKRKNTGALSARFSFQPSTDEQTERAWEEHLERMAQGGTYGDNMEIRAFTEAYNTDVKIFQYDIAYYVRAKDDGATRPVAYIAYHVRVL